jgi:hypothetical protein
MHHSEDSVDLLQLDILHTFLLCFPLKKDKFALTMAQLKIGRYSKFPGMENLGTWACMQFYCFTASISPSHIFLVEFATQGVPSDGRKCEDD